MYLEVEENPNTEESVSMRFKELGPPQKIKQIKVEDRSPGGELCWITGISDDADDPICPAYAQKVEESGMGRAYLIYGGPWGIRLRPVNSKEGWDIESPNQWGEAFLLLGDPRLIVFDETP